MNTIAKKLSVLHTHAEIVYGQDPELIVYREKDIIKLLVSEGIEPPVWDWNVNELDSLIAIAKEFNEYAPPKHFDREIIKRTLAVRKTPPANMEKLLTLYRKKYLLEIEIKELERKVK